MTTESLEDLPIHEETGRPLWKGLPVPWVTRWTGEKPPPRIPTMTIVDGVMWCTYGSPSAHPLGQMTGIKAERDEHDLLWYRELSIYGQGSGDATIQDRATIGEPQWTQVHAWRQRTCMLDRRCQVCAKPFDDTPVTFLLAVPTVRELNVIDPPVCRTCIPVALALCPVQRQEPRRVITAEAYGPTFVYADIPQVGGTRRARVSLDDRHLTYSVAKQLGVTITDYTMETIEL